MRRFILMLMLSGWLVVGLASPITTAPGYLDYPAIVARIQQLAAAHPDIARAINLNQLEQTPLTAEGRAIWALKISDRAADTEDEPSFLVDGCHHAREWITPHAVLDIADVLTSQYGVDPQVTRWVDHYEIWLVPCVNPDGLMYALSQDPHWRKNRDPNGDGTVGVDLNRNYPFMWGMCGANSGESRSEVYRGPFPASEAEVETLLALGAHRRPLFYLSYHSFGQEVLYPYRCASLAERRLYSSIRDQYMAAMDYGMRLASSSGESFEHFYNQFGSLSFLTEIAREFQPPFNQVPGILRRIRPGWQFLLDRGLGPSIWGHVRNAGTGEPVPNARISIEGIEFAEGERRRPEPLFGRYQWLLLPGTYTIRFSAQGFEPQSRTVTVTSEPSSVDVDLVPVDTVSRWPIGAGGEQQTWHSAWIGGRR